MRRIFSIIISASTLLFSHFVHAEAGWTDFVNAGELVPTSRNYYEVKLLVKENPSGCSDKHWFYQDYDSPGSDNMFKTLLEGIKSGIRVRVYVTGRCNIKGYSEISSVSIAP
jgi:hypothetical protein